MRSCVIVEKFNPNQASNRFLSFNARSVALQGGLSAITHAPDSAGRAFFSSHFSFPLKKDEFPVKSGLIDTPMIGRGVELPKKVPTRLLFQMSAKNLEKCLKRQNIGNPVTYAPVKVLNKDQVLGLLKSP